MLCVFSVLFLNLRLFFSDLLKLFPYWKTYAFVIGFANIFPHLSFVLKQFSDMFCHEENLDSFLPIQFMNL